MAAAKKKKTGNSRKKTTARSKKTQANSSNLVRVCLLFCVLFFSFIALFRFGMVGTFVFQLISILVGSLTTLFFVLCIAGCILALFKFDFARIGIRYYAGAGFLMLSWLIFQGIRTLGNASGWDPFFAILHDLLPILSASSSTSCGLTGAFFAGLFHTLFDTTGTMVLIVLLTILGVVLIAYEPAAALIADRKPREKKGKKQKQKPDYEEEPEQNETKPVSDSIFIEADEKPVKRPIFLTAEEEEPDEPAVHTVETKKIEEPEEISVQPAEYIASEEDAYANYKLPRLTILEDIAKRSRNNANTQAARTQGQKLIEILKEFGVDATLVQVHIGPSVTKFEIRPETGVRVSRISNLQGDIKMALAAKDIRIEAPIPGKSAVGIEVPNVEKTPVQMKEMMRNIPAGYEDKKLLFCLGKDLLGNCVYGELNKMPHLLIAGATGSGKSVCVNTIISSLLLRCRPDEVKLILIDPKKVEFTPYNDVPHLLAPVITDGDLANKALKVVVQMMEHRYDLFGELGVRNIQSYNDYVQNHSDQNLRVLPRIVVIIDELADLMLVAAKEVEQSIQRITQLARAAGIHLIVATQRPSVDVITGVIKANIPSRIAFAVSSATDSRTILDQHGAEKLLGYGDMLYLPNGESAPRRIQGVFIKDEEVNRIAQYAKSQATPHYDDAFIQLKDIQSQGGEVAGEISDPLYENVKHFVITSRKASTSLIQRKFSIGYSRAARLIDALEDQGIIGPANGSKPRAILVADNREDLSDD